METDAPFPIDENRWLKIKPKVLFTIIGIVGLAVWSWFTIKSDVNTIGKDVSFHGKTLEAMAGQLEAIQSEARASRETALRSQYQQDLINQKLDYLTGDKRGPRPATGSP